MNASVQSIDIAHWIQIALTPIFLISAIGVTLNVLTSRLARIVDRARAMEDRLRLSEHRSESRELHGKLLVLARRARWINAAITLITLSALFIALVVVMLFVNAFLRWDLSAFIAMHVHLVDVVAGSGAARVPDRSAHCDHHSAHRHRRGFASGRLRNGRRRISRRAGR